MFKVNKRDVLEPKKNEKNKPAQKKEEEKGCREQLFSEQGDNVWVHHRPLPVTWTVQPTAINSQTHETLKNAQIRKLTEERQMYMVTSEQARQIQERYEAEADAEKHHQRQLNRLQAGAGQKRTRQVLDKDFLEGDDDDDGHGVSLKNLKKSTRGGDADVDNFLRKTADHLG